MYSITINYNPEIQEYLFWFLSHFRDDELVYFENEEYSKDDILLKLTSAIKEIRTTKDENDELDKDMLDILKNIENVKNKEY